MTGTHGFDHRSKNGSKWAKKLVKCYGAVSVAENPLARSIAGAHEFRLQLRPRFIGYQPLSFAKLQQRHALKDGLVQSTSEWSQNLRHEEVLTTFRSYGAVGTRRQAEIIRDLANPQQKRLQDVAEITKIVVSVLEIQEGSSKP